MTTVAPKPRFFALIPCAGTGSRAGEAGPKQYQRLAGRSMIGHTVSAFRMVGQTLAGIWVVTAPGDNGFRDACPDFAGPGEVWLPQGGATRAQTVRNGLQAMLDHGGGNLAGPLDWVLVHDAARCLVTPEQINTLMAACAEDEVGGLLAQPLPDTLKSGNAGRVTGTIDRHDKWLAQTPQMFRIGALAAALDLHGTSATDEASAIEACGLAPRLVPGSSQNFKITYPEDFALAEAILLHRLACSSTIGSPIHEPA